MEKFTDFNLKLEENGLLIDVLIKNIGNLNRVSRFHDHYDELCADHKKLIELNLLYNKDLKPLEKDKNDQRKVLFDKTMTVIRVMQAFATDKKKKKLQMQLEPLTPEFLHERSDKELIKISRKIWLIANKHGGYATTFINRIKSALKRKNSKAKLKFEKKYGLIPEMIKSIEEANISFIELMLQYQDETMNKESIATEMKMGFKKTRKLITKKIDKFALLFENKDPNFYQEYTQVRTKQNMEPTEEILDVNRLEINEMPIGISDLKSAKTRRKITPVVEE
ncbi:MAG: hypothetical protein WCJ95_09060 [Mariniphaga sp.]